MTKVTKLEIEMTFHKPETPFILGSKGQRSGSRVIKTCVGLQTQRNIASGRVRKQCWVFPASLPRRTSDASDTVFSLRHARQTDRRFYRACSFSQSASGETIAGVGRGIHSFEC